MESYEIHKAREGRGKSRADAEAEKSRGGVPVTPVGVGVVGGRARKTRS